MSACGRKPNADPLVGTVLGRYLLTRLVGEGGMAVVYEATDRDLGRRVAIKTLHERRALSPDVRMRFLREGQTASKIRHPNVAAIYDVGRGSRPYLVMEYLEGEDLARCLLRQKVLGVEQTADLISPVVAAVAAAHDLGVVHRDLKPDNIFLSVEQGSIKPKVLDFGISKIADQPALHALTTTGEFLGTIGYVSPEQAQDSKSLDGRSDQYSIGVILYECTTGRRPIEDSSYPVLLERVIAGQFTPPRSINPNLPDAFQALILKAMSRDPAQRFPTTRALGRALLEFASEAVQASLAGELQDGNEAPRTAQAESGLAAAAASKSGTRLALPEAARARLPAHAARRHHWLGAAVALIAAIVAIAAIVIWAPR
ncbi:MAG TPA: serine/threonine-protein kinase [Polyangiaceae bacterium]|nr:serine/threonine-protein kinase [Polyangiaceae bacterium]